MARSVSLAAADEAEDEDLPPAAAAAGVTMPHSGGSADAPGALARWQQLVVGAEGTGQRLDRYLAARLAATSRTCLQRWIAQDAVLLNGVRARARATVQAGDRIELRPSTEAAARVYGPEPMALQIVYEDESLLVIDKPAGLVVHPGAGNWSGTLLNGLLAYDPRLAGVARAGIVHRLDAGTSGLMVVARTPAAQLELVRQLQLRSVVREYWALTSGALAPEQTIDAALGRDPRNPLRFRVTQAPSAKPARTHVRSLAQWPVPGTAAVLSWLACRLDTGRTHQIRVHLESIGHPIVGDPLYRRHAPAQLLGQCLAEHRLDHQALHACRLALVHPLTGATMAWTRPPPPDLRRLLLALGARPAQLRPPVRGYFPPQVAAAARRAAW